MSFCRGPRRQAIQNFEHLCGVRAGGQNAFLSPPEFGRRHHFHGFGNLLSGPNAGNSFPNIPKACFGHV
jgi:hypothetical protein